MARSPAYPDPDIPEFAVNRWTLMRFFHPPIGDTKFTELVSQGLIVEVPKVRGMYKLNTSLVRLGLRAVPCLPPSHERTKANMASLACWLAAPDVCLRPSWLAAARDAELLVFTINLAIRLFRKMEGMKRPEDRRKFLQDILDHQDWE